VYLLFLVDAVIRGADGYARFIAWSAQPWVLALNAVSLLFIVLHAVTFFDAAPRAMVVHVGRTRVSERLVLAGHYLGWAAASVFVAWLLLS
jgi:fumarate reductase subunit C